MDEKRRAFAWNRDVFSTHGVLYATAACPKKTVVCTVGGISINVFVVESLDSHVFAIIAVWLWTYLIQKLCKLKSKTVILSKAPILQELSGEC